MRGLPDYYEIIFRLKNAPPMPLPVAGLLSTATAEDVVRGLNDIRRVARELGSPLSCPFGTLSFLALSVIPELRITDQGLFDVIEQRFISSRG